jgi:hypothetical protein
VAYRVYRAGVRLRVAKVKPDLTYPVFHAPTPSVVTWATLIAGCLQIPV